MNKSGAECNQSLHGSNRQKRRSRGNETLESFLHAKTTAAMKSERADANAPIPTAREERVSVRSDGVVEDPPFPLPRGEGQGEGILFRQQSLSPIRPVSPIPISASSCRFPRYDIGHRLLNLRATFPVLEPR
jgi:hypothetical protein